MAEESNLPSQITQKGLRKGSEGSPVPMTLVKLSHNVASQTSTNLKWYLL